MKRPVRHGWLPLILSLALVGAACGRNGQATARGQVKNQSASPKTVAPPPAPVDPVATNEAMRQLWEQHVAWTRFYVVSALAGLPDTQPTFERMLRNQDDIGRAVKPYYGEEAGTQLIVLLRTHITQAADLLKAAKAGDQAALAKARQAWYANADDIAAFLSRVNPKNWPVDRIKTMLHTELDQTIAETTNRLNGNYQAEFAAYDAAEDQILKLADTFSSGIVAQFPDRFSPPSVPPSQVAFRNAMRKVWEDDITWNRLSIVSALSGLPDAQLTAQRLLRTQDDIGAAVKPYYGEAAGTKLAQLLRTHVTQEADLLKAAKAGDQAALGKAKDAWYASGDDIAAFLSHVNPSYGSVDHLKALWRGDLDQTFAEVTNRLNGNHEAEIADQDIIEDQTLGIADTLSSGIVAQFPDKFAA